MKINEILKQINIVDVIKKYIPLTKKGQNYQCLCPFHSDKNPSLIISEKKQIFKCFVCNTAGNAIKFLTLYNKYSLMNALVELINQFNLNINLSNISKIDLEKNRIYQLNEMVCEWYHDFLLDDKNQQWLNYLLNRKISLETIKLFKLGFANDTNIIVKLCANYNNIRNLSDNQKDQIYSYNELEEYSIANLNDPSNPKDFFVNRIIFPIYDIDNNVIGFSGRTINDSTPKYLNSKNTKVFTKSDILYNINNLDFTNDTLYIVEGFFDLLSLYENNIKNVIATMGVNLSSSHIDLLKSKKIKNLILAFDNDEAGISTMIKNCLTLAKSFNLFIINKYDNQYKDFNEILIKDPDYLLKVIKDYSHFSVYYLKYLLASEDKNLINYNELIKFVNKYGSKTYINEYITLIHDTLNIDKDLISKDLIFNNQEEQLVINVDQITNEELIKEKNKNNFYEALINIFQLRYLTLVEFMLVAKDYMQQIIKEIDFDLYLAKKLQIILVIISEYYEQFGYSTILTNKENFKKYCDEKYPKYTDVLVNILNEVIKKNKNQIYQQEELEKLIIDTKIILYEIKKSFLLKIAYKNNQDEISPQIIKINEKIVNLKKDLYFKKKKNNLNN